MDMGRCVYCHSVVTSQEDSCYVCGDSVPQHVKGPVERRPVSALTKVAFVSGLDGLTPPDISRAVVVLALRRHLPLSPSGERARSSAGPLVT